MNSYVVHFEGKDGAAWRIVVRAHGISLHGDLVVFWKRSGWFRETLHIVRKDVLINIADSRYIQ